MPEFAKLLSIRVVRPDPEDDHVDVYYTMQNEDMDRTVVNSSILAVAGDDIPGAITSDSAGYGVDLR